MAYPKPYAPVTLKRLYKNLNLPQETVDLLHRYFTAMSHFYLAIPLEEAWRIIRKQNPDLDLNEEKFNDFASIVRREEQPYRISGIEEFYTQEEPTTGLQRWIAVKEICGRNRRDFRILDHESYNKPWFVPDKEELLRYEDPTYRKILPEERAFREILVRNAGASQKIMDSIVQSLYTAVRSSNYQVESLSQFLISLLESHELEIEDLDRFESVMARGIDLLNAWPLPFNHGYSASELRRRGDGKIYSISVGPNVRKAIADGSLDPMDFLLGVLSAEGMTDEAMDQAIEQAEELMNAAQRFQNRKVLKALKVPKMRKVLLAQLAAAEEAEKRGEEPYARSKKVGRNDPCPCGSGKKYKNCCGRPKRFS